MYDLDTDISNDLVSLKIKKRDLLGYETNVLVHYVNVSSNTDRATNEIKELYRQCFIS